MSKSNHADAQMIGALALPHPGSNREREAKKVVVFLRERKLGPGQDLMAKIAVDFLKSLGKNWQLSR